MRFKANNHFVPSIYLKNFSEDRIKICTYNTLVPHKQVPNWQSISIKKAASVKRHLYTSTISGQESDELENWFDKEFETPVREVINKVIINSRMTKEDWTTLIKFAALQRVRTVSFFLQNKIWQEQEIPKIIKRKTIELNKKLQEENYEELINNSDSEVFNYNFPIKVSIQDLLDNKNVKIEMQALTGRSMWLSSVKRLVLHTASILHQHKWTILLAPQNTFWVTSDNPVLQLNFFNYKKYNLAGEWGGKGTEIILPLSPKHLLYTQVGCKVPVRGTKETKLSINKAILIQKALIENAHRQIFAYRPTSEVMQFRKREIDKEKFEYEQQEWNKWHEEQTSAELEFARQ